MLEFRTTLSGKVFFDWLPSSRKICNRHQVLYWTALALHKTQRKSLIGFLEFYCQVVCKLWPPVASSANTAVGDWRMKIRLVRPSPYSDFISQQIRSAITESVYVIWENATYLGAQSSRDWRCSLGSWSCRDRADTGRASLRCADRDVSSPVAYFELDTSTVYTCRFVSLLSLTVRYGGQCKLEIQLYYGSAGISPTPWTSLD